MSLTGVDSYYWFSPSSPSYDPNPYFTWANLAGGQHPMHRWTISTPGQLAMFPANALLYRKGYINQGETVVHEERTLQSIYDRKMPWKSANTQVTIKLKNTGINQATLLDVAGYAKSTIEISRVGDELQFTLPANAMYVMLENITHSGKLNKNEKGIVELEKIFIQNN